MIFIKSEGFNVIFFNESLEVVVTDANTSHRKEENRLSGSALLGIIDNILRMTKTPFTLKGNTQERSYAPNGSYNLEVYQETNGILLFTLDEDEDGIYTVELELVKGSYTDLLDILGL